MLDTKFLNKISGYFLVIVALLCMAAGYTTGMERTVANNGYIHDNVVIKEDILRLAKNLQRYYIYYADFDQNLAENRLEAVSLYKNSKIKVFITEDAEPDEIHFDIYGRRVENIDDVADRNVIYDSDTVFESQSKEKTVQEDILYDTDIENPAGLYEIDYQLMTDDELDKYQQSLSETIENYRNIQEYLSTMHDFHFYILDKNNNICVATNTENILSEKYYDYVEISDSIFDTVFNGESISFSFSKAGYLCLITIPVNGISQDMLKEINYTHKLYSVNKIVSSYSLPAVFYIFGICILVYLSVFRRNEIINFFESIFVYYKKIPLFIKGIIIALSVIKINNMYFSDTYNITYYIINLNIIRVIHSLLLTFACFLTIILAFKHFYKLCKRQIHLKEEFEARVMANCINDIKIMIKANEQIVVCISVMLIFFAILPALCMIFIFVSFNISVIDFIVAVGIYFLYVLILWIVYKYINNTTKLKYYIKEIANGNLSTIPEEYGIFSKPINNLNNINSGLQNNLEQMIKSERLKTELITNVSHDLKTPLTSIINYLSLLKNIDLDTQQEQAKEYINIANDKARRLNILILDLFEASKLNSGQMQLEKMPSDVVALIKQTLGELDYKINQSGIEFKVNLPSNPIIIDMDGQRMWRVFDNLLTNILKYSPSGSRGYIDLTEYDDKVAIVFKNVSSYPLDFDGAELFERFKRGDISRSTDGSGLGLSIAKSIVELHNGTLDIVIDGDLFKAIVVLNKI